MLSGGGGVGAENKLSSRDVRSWLTMLQEQRQLDKPYLRRRGRTAPLSENAKKL